jgi:hypothetical protein
VPGIVAPPDVEAGVIEYLVGRAAVTSLAGNVGWRIRAPWPCLRVVRVGGTTDEILRVDDALVQLEAWGNPDDTSSAQRIALARLLAVAEAELLAIPGRVTATTVFVRARILNRGQWAPDDSTEQQRYFSRLTVAAHAV